MPWKNFRYINPSNDRKGSRFYLSRFVSGDEHKAARKMTKFLTTGGTPNCSRVVASWRDILYEFISRGKYRSRSRSPVSVIGSETAKGGVHS